VKTAPIAAASLVEKADEYFRRLRRKLPRGCEAELYLAGGRERGIEMRDGRPETIHESCDEGVGLRLIRQGRMGFAYASGLGPKTLDTLLSQALAQQPHSPADPHRGLPAPAEPADEEPLELEDPSLLVEPLEAQMPKLRAMEETALQAEPHVKRVLRLGYGESAGETVILNTLGIRAIERGTHCSVGLAISAEKDGQVQIGSGSSSGRFYEGLDFDRAAREGARRASVLIDSKKLPTGRRAVLFDPWVAGEFIEIIAGALSADEVQRGKSLFQGKLGKRVASDRVRIIDDPHRRRGSASSRFDDEGVPTRKKVLIDGGVLKELLFDTYTANKDGRASNGAAGRASYRGTPAPSSSNLYLEPGAMSREELIRDTRDGILVFEVMGMHTTDPVSGEFSVGLSGIAVENGQLTHGVRGAMLAGNVLQMLERVDAVADDLTFYGRLAAPTFRVPDLTVA